jgi:hypothetical protein
MPHNSEAAQMQAFTVRSPSCMHALLLARPGQPEAAFLRAFGLGKKDRIVAATAGLGPGTIAGLSGTGRGCFRSRPDGGRRKHRPRFEMSGTPSTGRDGLITKNSHRGSGRLAFEPLNLPPDGGRRIGKPPQDFTESPGRVQKSSRGLG